QARTLVAALPPFVTTVALFMDAAATEVQRILNGVAIDLLQFHGEESATFCASFGRPYIKSVPMGESQDVAAYAARYADAAGLLLDSNALGVAGGSGERFDWQRMPQDVPMPLILAGGLRPDNVAEAIAIAAPYGVDVSSGVERERGVKDPALILRFIDEVNGVEQKNR
ncbi:MAG: phosphoribosylanthranilate isomerase, partial [Gammaproteobacteria bacterium]|nr:phosphoribosylanthranilate isomerase [Gammaproteobacteria bacterium]